MDARAERLRMPAQHRTIVVGDVDVSFVPDGFVELEPTGWFRTRSFASPPAVNATGHMVASVGSIVVREASGIVVIDAGLGPVSVPASQTHPSLGAMHGGLDPDFTTRFGGTVLALAVTHAHEDHVGWLQGRHGLLPDHTVHVGAADAGRLRRSTGRSKVRSLRGGERLSPAVRAVATAGHTAGHMAYVVESAGHRAIVFGDVFHNPVQFADPALAPWSDELPADARRSRAQVTEMLLEPGVVGVGCHFGDVVFGRLVDGRWEPVATR